MSSVSCANSYTPLCSVRPETAHTADPSRTGGLRSVVANIWTFAARSPDSGQRRRVRANRDSTWLLVGGMFLVLIVVCDLACDLWTWQRLPDLRVLPVRALGARCARSAGCAVRRDPVRDHTRNEVIRPMGTIRETVTGGRGPLGKSVGDRRTRGGPGRSARHPLGTRCAPAGDGHPTTCEHRTNRWVREPTLKSSQSSCPPFGGCRWLWVASGEHEKPGTLVGTSGTGVQILVASRARFRPLAVEPFRTSAGDHGRVPRVGPDTPISQHARLVIACQRGCCADAEGAHWDPPSETETDHVHSS